MRRSKSRTELEDDNGTCEKLATITDESIWTNMTQAVLLKWRSCSTLRLKSWVGNNCTPQYTQDCRIPSLKSLIWCLMLLRSWMTSFALSVVFKTGLSDFTMVSFPQNGTYLYWLLITGWYIDFTFSCKSWKCFTITGFALVMQTVVRIEP